MNIIGIDSGSTATKGVLLHMDTQQLDTCILPTGGNPKGAIEDVLHRLGATGNEKIVTTGYGRQIIQADKSVTEITCHAKGARYLNSAIQNVIDIGGQDSKAVRLNEKGAVMDFIMNDKCAAGTGKFIEVIMKTLGEKIDTLDDFTENAQPVNINSMCTVFAESEVISLMAKGEKRENIMMGIIHSIARRTANQFLKLNPQGATAFTGGLARSNVFVSVLSSYIGGPLCTHPLSPYAGAIGAALTGAGIIHNPSQQK